MRSIFGLVLLVGLGLAGFAAYMAQNYIAGYQSELAKERAARSKMVKTVDVFVSNLPLPYGHALTPEDVRKVSWPEDAVPEGAFLKAADLFPEHEDKPRVVLRAMEKDEAIMAIKVTEPGKPAGLTSQLQPGMRAFAIRVDVASGVSGFLRPGDRVDVYWSGGIARLSNDKGVREFTKLIEAGLKLIAVDQSAYRDGEEANIARTVTVSARPDQVAKLAQAQATGKLSLALVGMDETIVAEEIEVDQRVLLGFERPNQPIEKIVAAPVEDRTCTIRTRRGAEVVSIPVPCTN